MPPWNARQCISTLNREERENHLVCFLSAKTEEWKRALGSFASYLFGLWSHIYFFSLFSASKWIAIQYQYKHYFDAMLVFTCFVLSMPFFQTNFLYSWIVLTSIAADMKCRLDISKCSRICAILLLEIEGLGLGFFLRRDGVGVCSFIKLEKPIVFSYAFNFLYVDIKLK